MFSAFNENYRLCRMKPGKEKLDKLKELIIRGAFDIPDELVVAPGQEHRYEAMFRSLDTLFGSLGVTSAGISKGYEREDPVSSRYGVFGYDATKLDTDKFGDHAHLFVGPKDPEEGHSNLFTMIAVSDVVEGRTHEEGQVLQGLVDALNTEHGFEHSYTDEVRRFYQHRNQFGRSKWIKCIYTLDRAAIEAPGNTASALLRVPRAYATFVSYQQQKDWAIDAVVQGLHAQTKQETN
jgi:hypothetical protein